MRHKPQQQRSERMLLNIQQATLELIASDGVEGLSTRKIAGRAGISVGTLYHYFADKQQVLRGLERRFVDDLLQRLGEAAPVIVRLDIGSAVREIAGIYHQQLTRDDGSWLALHQQMLRRGVEFTGDVERFLSQVTIQYLNHHPELATLHDFPRLIYILLNACAFNLMRHAENPPPNIDSASLIDGLVDLCVAYVDSQRPTA